MKPQNIEIWVKMPSGWTFLQTVSGWSLEVARDSFQERCPGLVSARWAS